MRLLLVIGGYLLRLSVLKPLSAVSALYLRLVLIALDHLLEVLFHGQLARAARHI